MPSYIPVKVTGNTTGLVQNREEFILPDDAYPVLENAFVWRERIKRKQGTELLGRLRRTFTSLSLGNSGTSPWIFNLFSTLVPPIVPETNAEIQPGSVVITVGTDTFTDLGNGTLQRQDGNIQSTINYISGIVTLYLLEAAGTAATVNFNYYPDLPVMGLRDRQLSMNAFTQTVAFDTVYAYRYTSAGWVEFIPGTTWTGSDSNFFWSTNYWVSNANIPLFWVTNFSGTGGDPIRYTDGVTWTDFAPQIDAAGNLLTQCLALVRFRGRLLAFNTLEGMNLATSTMYPQRIRWSAIGSPLATTTNSWRDDITGKGGFLNLPTSQPITAVGFVRDNLVIYCTSSTWQFRYTGRAINPFQIEQVNSELGTESLFSAIQFDTSLMGIGDKGIVECDSFKSQRIDIKIPDLVFKFNNDNKGPSRIQGIRDFFQKLAYWTYPFIPENEDEIEIIYPNRRLLYNYENDSWAIFTDSFTALGNFRPPSGRTWYNTKIPWNQCNFPWANRPALIPTIIGGNQQGFVSYLDQKTTNDPSLFIQNVTGNTTTPTVITSPNHNLTTDDVITISGIPLGTPFANTLNNPQQGLITAITNGNPAQITSVDHDLFSGEMVEISGVGGMVELNGNMYTVIVIDADNFTINVDSTSFPSYTSGGMWTNQAINAFGVGYVDANNFQLFVYNTASGNFDIPQLDPPQTYIGGGQISVRDNFTIQSKKFNYIDQGSSIQLGYVDLLMSSTDDGAITMNVYADYNNSNPVNVLQENINPDTLQPDSFFNSTISTANTSPSNVTGSKYLQRIFCPVRSNFITLEYTLSNAQLAGIEQESNVQIDSQVIWMRPAGRLTNI